MSKILLVLTSVQNSWEWLQHGVLDLLCTKHGIQGVTGSSHRNHCGVTCMCHYDDNDSEMCWKIPWESALPRVSLCMGSADFWQIPPQDTVPFWELWPHFSVSALIQDLPMGGSASRWESFDRCWILSITVTCSEASCDPDKSGSGHLTWPVPTRPSSSYWKPKKPLTLKQNIW